MGQPPPGRWEIFRLMVAVDAFTSISSSKAWQCSSRVRSGLLRRWSGNHSSSIAPLMAGGPVGTLAPTSPVSLRLFSQRLMEGSEIPKILATSALGLPRSTASSTFTLRSFEYARMPNSVAEDQTSCKPLLVKLGLQYGCCNLGWKEFCRTYVFPANRNKTKSRRGDSNRLPLLQLRVCGQWLLSVARVCKYRIGKGFCVPL